MISPSSIDFHPSENPARAIRSLNLGYLLGEAFKPESLCLGDEDYLHLSLVLALTQDPLLAEQSLSSVQLTAQKNAIIRPNLGFHPRACE